MLAVTDIREIKYYRVADRSNCLHFGMIDVLQEQKCNILLDGFLCKCSCHTLFHAEWEAPFSWDVLPSWKTWSRWNTDQEGEDLVRKSVFTDLHNLCTTQPLSSVQSWAIAMLTVWEFSWTVRVCMEKSGKRALQCFAKKPPHPVFCAWSTARKDTRSGSRGIQLVISEVLEQQWSECLQIV